MRTNFKRSLLTPFAASAFVLAACAQLIPIAHADVRDVPAGTYVLDNSHTNVIFSVNHLGFSNYMGRFNSIGGTLNFDPNAVENSTLDVTIDPASIDTNHVKLQTELRSEKYMNTSKFPTIRFTSTKVQKTSKTTGLVTGNLTFMGVTQPITLNVTLNGAGKHPMGGKPTIGFGATGKLKRSDFGFTALTPAVGDEVALTIETEFNQK